LPRLGEQCTQIDQEPFFIGLLRELAPQVGFEPTTLQLQPSALEQFKRSRYQFPGFLGIAWVATTGQGALIAVTHIFPRKTLLLPGADWFQMSTPAAPGTLLACWMGGFPTTTFCLTLLFVAAENTTMPFELPTAVLASTMLLSPDTMPMPKSTAVPVA